MAIDRSLRLTRRQRTVLQTLEFVDRLTARWMGVRSDVLWRLEERGMVGRNAHDEWYITDRGREAIRGEES